MKSKYRCIIMYYNKVSTHVKKYFLRSWRNLLPPFMSLLIYSKYTTLKKKYWSLTTSFFFIFIVIITSSMVGLSCSHYIITRTDYTPRSSVGSSSKPYNMKLALINKNNSILILDRRYVHKKSTQKVAYASEKINGIRNRSR